MTIAEIRKATGSRWFPHQGGSNRYRIHGQPIATGHGFLFISSERTTVWGGRRFTVRTYDSKENEVGVLGHEHGYLTHSGAMQALAVAITAKPARLSGRKINVMKDPKEKNAAGDPAQDENTAEGGEAPSGKEETATTGSEATASDDAEAQESGEQNEKKENEEAE